MITRVSSNNPSQEMTQISLCPIYKVPNKKDTESLSLAIPLLYIIVFPLFSTLIGLRPKPGT
jgi:hypothetical protein